MHCYNAYAVKDRTDSSHLSTKVPDFTDTPLLSIPVSASSSDTSVLYHNFCILISRHLVSYMRYFTENYEDVVLKHIPHDYSDEMKEKSEIVSHVMWEFVLIQLYTF